MHKMPGRCMGILHKDRQDVYEYIKSPIYWYRIRITQMRGGRATINKADAKEVRLCM